MKTRILLITIIAFTGFLSVPSIANAQDDSLNRAREAFDKGQDFFQADKFSEAGEQFKIAYVARPFTQFLFNIGACYEKANDYPQALSYYEKYLEAAPEAKDKDKTLLRIEALKTAIGDITAKGTDPSQAAESVTALEKVKIPGLVVIESIPVGVSIYLDSRDTKPIGKTPWNGSLTGQHLVILEMDGYDTLERKVLADANRLFVWTANLAKKDYLGNLEVVSNIPGSAIYIDDRSVGIQGKTPWSREMKPGKHTIWITKEGYDVYEKEIEIIPGKTSKISANLSGDEVGYINVLGTGVENYKIVVDGKVLCARGPCREPLSPGEHRVSIRRDDYRSYNTEIDVQSKTEVTVRARLAPDPSRLDAYVTYALAAAFVGGGYYLGTRAQDIKNELARDIVLGNPPPDSNDPRLGWGLQSGKTYAMASNVGYAVGGGTFLLAVYYSFRNKGKPSTGKSSIRAISFQPQIRPNYSGVGLAGSF